MQTVPFQNIKTIAVIGLSDKPERPSFAVATYLRQKGFAIIPVNPFLKSWNGLDAYPDLASVPRSIRIDAVDIFRKSEEVLPVVETALKRGDIHTVWMQEGVDNPQAAQLARSRGLNVVSNVCMMKTHQSQLTVRGKNPRPFISMFKPNEGKADRIIRLVAGTAALYLGLAVFSGASQVIALIVAVLMLATGATGFCALYKIFGITTAGGK